MRVGVQNGHSLEDLLDFLSHAGERGLMPVATAQALGVATRNVFSVLDDGERVRLPFDDLDGVIRRFNNKRARDFSPASLKEYDRRVRRAVELYQQWKNDPANFTVRTRATNTSKRREKPNDRSTSAAQPRSTVEDVDATGGGIAASVAAGSAAGYRTAFPVRPGHVVVVENIPFDLSQSEADRLAQFIRLLAPA